MLTQTEAEVVAVPLDRLAQLRFAVFNGAASGNDCPSHEWDAWPDVILAALLRAPCSRPNPGISKGATAGALRRPFANLHPFDQETAG